MIVEVVTDKSVGHTGLVAQDMGDLNDHYETGMASFSIAALIM